MSVDLLIVGGGPVGLVTALIARRRGLVVEVVEPRVQPVDKACGEGIMPAGLALLSELKIDPPGHVIRGIRYLSEDRSVDARFSRGVGRGVRRTQLQLLLLEAVRAEGVTVHSSAVVGIAESASGVEATLRDGASRHASFVAGADGLHSSIRRLCGLSAPARRAVRRRGLRRHFAVEPWSDLVEVHWSPAAEAYVTPVGERLVGVAVLTERVGSFDEQLADFPALGERLRRAPPASSITGAGPFRQRTTARTRGRVALVGDAAGYVDAITGEGLTVGWRQAAALVDAIASGSLDGYERDWRRVVRRSTMLTSGLLAAARIPAARRILVPSAVRMPRLFGQIVDLASRG